MRHGRDFIAWFTKPKTRLCVTFATKTNTTVGMIDQTGSSIASTYNSAQFAVYELNNIDASLDRQISQDDSLQEADGQ